MGPRLNLQDQDQGTRSQDQDSTLKTKTTPDSNLINLLEKPGGVAGVRYLQAGCRSCVRALNTELIVLKALC